MRVSRRKLIPVDQLPIDVLIEVSAAVKNKSDLERKLYGAARSGRANALERRLSDLGIETNHWTGRHVRHVSTKVKKSLSQLSKQGARKRILEEKLLEERCARCGRPPEWLGEPLTLHLDHIDGNGTNHDLANLRFLCPNCHQQTATWGNKRARRLPEDDVVLRELAKTKSYSELAEMFGVSVSTISHRLRKYYA